MVKKVSVQVHFSGAGPARKPVAISRRHKVTGHRILVEIHPEMSKDDSLFVLFRVGSIELILAASNDREQLKAIRQRLGTVARHYDIAKVPVLDVFE
jgi:hypothetical protein